MSVPVQSKQVLVIGAGVIGLTTAIRLLQRKRNGTEKDGGHSAQSAPLSGVPYAVTVLADVFPTDLEIKEDRTRAGLYTSWWAGAHHVSTLDPTSGLGAINKTTFDELYPLSGSHNNFNVAGLRRIRQEEYIAADTSSESIDNLGKPSPFSWMPEYQKLSGPHIQNAAAGESFNTFTIDPSVYLPFLLAKFLSLGGKIIRGHVQHISELFDTKGNLHSPHGEWEGFWDGNDWHYDDWTLDATTSHEGARIPHQEYHPPQTRQDWDAIFVCTGLRSRQLGGIEDESVYPARGQTVILRAPWVSTGRTLAENPQLGSSGHSTYIIPRGGKHRDVVVGGVYDADDWHHYPRREVRDDLLRRGLKLCPELVPESSRRVGVAPTIADLLPLIVEEGCGLRPMRFGGPRIEVVGFPTARGKIPVVFNYGHGATGYISSIGSALEAIRIFEEYGDKGDQKVQLGNSS